VNAAQGSRLKAQGEIICGGWLELVAAATLVWSNVLKPEA